MSALFASGRIVDLILALTVLEAIAVTLYSRRTGRGVKGANLLPNLLAGACLLLAVRGALTGSSWTRIALSLLGALLAHLADLRQRWT